MDYFIFLSFTIFIFTTQNYSMSKILIIEDEAAIRRVLVKILSEENDSYKVDEAEDGHQGLEKAKNEDYDLILCDIKMPKMDGVEVLDAVKKTTRSTNGNDFWAR